MLNILRLWESTGFEDYLMSSFLQVNPEKPDILKPIMTICLY